MCAGDLFFLTLHTQELHPSFCVYVYTPTPSVCVHRDSALSICMQRPCPFSHMSTGILTSPFLSLQGDVGVPGERGEAGHRGSVVSGRTQPLGKVTETEFMGRKG